MFVTFLLLFLLVKFISYPYKPVFTGLTVAKERKITESNDDVVMVKEG